MEEKKEKAFSKEKKDDDTSTLFVSHLFLVQFPYANVQKVSALQEARVFNDSHVNPKKCIAQLLKILYLIGQGETFSQQEATDLFFSVTKLFISENV